MEAALSWTSDAGAHREAVIKKAAQLRYAQARRPVQSPAQGRRRTGGSNLVPGARPGHSVEAALLDLQRMAGNGAVASLLAPRPADSNPRLAIQRKLGPWLTEHSQPVRDALGTNPPEYDIAFRQLNGFSLDDIVAIVRDLGAGKLRDLKKNTAAMAGYDVPRLTLALNMASAPPSIAGERAERIHDLIRGFTFDQNLDNLQAAYRLINGLSVEDQERALKLLTPDHLDVLTAHVAESTGVDIYWVAMILVGLRGSNVNQVWTSLTWLNGREIVDGCQWVAGQNEDRVAFMLRPSVLQSTGGVFNDRNRVMLLAGRAKQGGQEITPVVAARLESAFQAAALPAAQRQSVRELLGIPQPALAEAELTDVGLSQEKVAEIAKKGSDDLNAQTQALFGQSYADFLGTIRVVKAFGTSAEVAPEMGRKLIEADSKAREYIAETEGRAMEADDWDVKSMTGRQGPGTALHQWGLAVDIDYAGQPYLMHESGEAPLDRKLKVVYNRIALLMLDRLSKIVTGTADFAAYSEESTAMKRYFALMDGRESLEDFLAANTRPDASWTTIFDSQSVLPSDRAAQLRARMAADHAALIAPPEPNTEAVVKPGGRRPMMDSPFDATKHADPRGGFLTMRKEVVRALRDVGMRWGGMDFGGENGDIMHFDLGKTYVYNQDRKTYERKGGG
jgi:hypothetical protein